MCWDDSSFDDVFYRQLIFKYETQKTAIKVLETEIKTLELKLDVLSREQGYVHSCVKTKNLEKVIKHLKDYYLILLKSKNEKMFDNIFTRSFSYNKYEEFEYRMAPNLGYRFYSSKYEKFIKKYENIVSLIKQKIKELTVKIDKENEKLLKREKKNIYKLKYLSHNSKQR